MGFQSFGSYLPGVAVPMVKEKMQQETANVILPAEPELLAEHLQARRDAGMRMNVNFLGEALLGEDDANARLQKYLQAMQNPSIEVISVKISTIYSQISSLAFEHTLDILCDRLELLYRASAKSTFTRADGTTVPKFVYLDMEEYRDMRLTSEAFRRTLSRPGLENVQAGIVLQAYIPDSFAAQKALTNWAQTRVESGGAPITMRIVKGANMEMERFEAGLHGWSQAQFVRSRLCFGKSGQAKCFGQNPIRNARRNGESPATRLARVGQKLTALCAGVPQRRIYSCDRLSRSPFR